MRRRGLERKRERVGRVWGEKLPAKRTCVRRELDKKRARRTPVHERTGREDKKMKEGKRKITCGIVSLLICKRIHACASV